MEDLIYSLSVVRAGILHLLSDSDRHKLLELGLVAGDYPKLYITDKGDRFIEAWKVFKL